MQEAVDYLNKESISSLLFVLLRSSCLAVSKFKASLRLCNSFDE